MNTIPKAKLSRDRRLHITGSTTTIRQRSYTPPQQVTELQLKRSYQSFELLEQNLEWWSQFSFDRARIKRKIAIARIRHNAMFTLFLTQNTIDRFCRHRGFVFLSKLPYHCSPLQKHTSKSIALAENIRSKWVIL